jgi:hypothetical protein
VLRGLRLGPVPHVRPCEAAGMRELQAEIQIVVRVRAEAFAVRRDEQLAQRGERRLGAIGQHQLIGIRTAVVTDGDGLTAPDEFRAARAEPLPAPPREVARLAVDGAVPAFHRQHAETIADAHASVGERPRERRLGRRQQRLVEAQIDPASCEMSREGVGVLERGHADIARVAF